MNIRRLIYHVQFSCSVMSNSLWPHDRSTPGLPVHHQLPEFTQTHVHRVSDAIQPSALLSSPSPPTFNLSQHQGLFPKSQFFPSGGQSIRVWAWASVLPVNIQDWFPLGWTGWISLQSKSGPETRQISETGVGGRDLMEVLWVSWDARRSETIKLCG